MINCLIVDDEPLALDLIESYVRKTPFLNLVGRCNNAIAAMEAIHGGGIDLLFLDIQMPELNGLELSKMISDKTKVIFTTAFQQYALDGYKVNALDYLLKPISYQEFLQAANKAAKLFNLLRNQSNGEAGNDSIFVKTEYKLVQIFLNDILYVEGLKDYVKIYLESATEPILSLMSMKSVEERLPPDKFMRVHRSFIVQLDKIKTIERNRIVFGKIHIPISDSYKDHFMEFLNKRFFA
ncbi:LytR/AlgR family response regulator transcription factor [Paludibacter jiangxiensis]|uniref:DNA-binding response regulator, LytR/AlgR family n=1 Tax=Paludibacter jiangxiensis TaxID=681398 RepID=A0A161LFR9_9BACT|nr:LytTR family DNA-binding domain-containing protein [Paludibacter jiangxiensis]GAT63517.1 DNA-binding response regulator, LytR/AlgR family [Paludibacter jiangxiensis]